MKAPERKKAYRLACANKMKAGMMADGRGGWIAQTGGIGQMIGSGANHRRS